MSTPTAAIVTDTESVIEKLMESPEPSIRWKTRTGILGEDGDSPSNRALLDEIHSSERVRSLLARRDDTGRLEPVGDVYAKWQGAHWVLSHLADIGYPPGDPDLNPIRDQLLDCWLDEQYFDEYEAKSKSKAYSRQGSPVMRGRHRQHASQHGNALWSILRLGLADQRTEQLAERLLRWQWPDGGWNCDKKPDADSSSFMETLYPTRALSIYGEKAGDETARKAASRAARIFLDRYLYKRRSDGGVMHPEFVKLHYPLYWHYDFLGGLKAMAETGFIDDANCGPALDLLVEMRLPDGGWPALSKYYKCSTDLKPGNDSVDWGGTSKRKMNEWVTVDALTVLRAAGRLAV